MFLFALHAARGWSIPLVSAAVTTHFLLGAVLVANLPAVHRRFGVGGVTRLGGILSAIGLLGWALAAAPWQLFLATAVSGAGWAMTGAAAVNAMVAPWFARRRPAALSFAYNGASVGGIILSPLWVALIAALGLAGAAAVVGAAMAATLWWLGGSRLAAGPAALGQWPDGDAPAGVRDTAKSAAPAPRPVSPAVPPGLPGTALWRDRRFATLALATSLGLFAQIGLIAHLFSVMAVPLGPQLAGFAAGLATLCAILGRSAMGWVLRPGVDRRAVAAANYAVQVAGSLVLLLSGGAEVGWLLLGIVLFGLGLGNAASLPALIAQVDFAEADAPRAVALVTACSQAAYSFAPAAFGLLRATDDGAMFVVAGLVQALAALVLLRAGGRPADRRAVPP